ncbi:LOW QUALITY PROTEIN: cysteine protease ATG4D-like [Thalassophryne amazonica]|uniref:LOW QUALITY PROTEIN: cysteine protease ATG4D-like n=1 Tax=Thalassophryne amazonica TaxID=390379 RepID=UPI0014724027|nr:LOW QUALITY PROTEIN: cysteine protease ATG4D-like [Thalassophryne amazonica]
MNSVSPSAAQYIGGVLQDELGESHRPRSLERQGSFSRRTSQASDSSRDAAVELDEVDKLKAKLMSAWNNVKYGWTVKTKTSFNKTSPVTVLGHSYLLNSEEEVDRFRLAFVSRIWLTYRRQFPQLEGSTLTTDCGWGCMLRSGQMLLAQGLLVHLMPRDWVWPDAQQLTDVDLEVFQPHSPARAGGVPFPSFGSPRAPSIAENSRPSDQSPKCIQKKRAESERDRQAEPTHHRLVMWFGDQPPSPFGVHQLVETGKSSGKKAGDWYGPSIVAHILRKAVAKTTVVQNLVVYVAQDCTVYKEDVVQLCDPTRSQSVSEPSSHGWKSVILLVPVRLGGDSLNPSYIECVKNILKLECCIGVIGGKPKHSLYFIGFQDEQLLYLDPHYCQPVVDVTQVNFSLESFHCSSPKKMPFSRMDPSCTIGFYSRNKKEFESMCSAVSAALSSSKEKYPIFTFVEGRGQDYGLEGHSSGPAAHILPRGSPGRSNNRRNSEEFVFL